MFYVLMWIVACVVAGIVAKQKNRSEVGWCVGTLLFIPVIAVLFVLPKLPETSSTEVVS